MICTQRMFQQSESYRIEDFSKSVTRQSQETRIFRLSIAKIISEEMTKLRKNKQNNFWWNDKAQKE